MKFQIGDKARICGNVGDYSSRWLKHCLEVGRDVEIAGLFTGWKGHEAYNIKGSTEVLLAEELQPLIKKIVIICTCQNGLEAANCDKKCDRREYEDSL